MYPKEEVMGGHATTNHTPGQGVQQRVFFMSLNSRGMLHKKPRHGTLCVSTWNTFGRGILPHLRIGRFPRPLFAAAREDVFPPF